jgi:hypothetical protein
MALMAQNPGADLPSLDDDDWFGDGSAFDSGEDLAAALFAMAGADAPSEMADTSPLAAAVAAVAPPRAAPQPPAPPRAAPAVPDGPAVFEKFHVAAAPSTPVIDEQWVPIARPGFPAAEEPGPWKERPVRGDRKGWSIRQGVTMLKMTEEVITRLRVDAIEVAWAAAGVAVGQAISRPSGPGEA